MVILTSVMMRVLNIPTSVTILMAVTILTAPLVAMLIAPTSH
jgi:hypothetical protein